MPKNPEEYATIQNTTKEECFDRWKGVGWKAYDDNSEKGVCQSDYDFDEWANKWAKEQEAKGASENE